MKNPFEIRTEVLAMAKDYMDKQYALNMEMLKKMSDATGEAMKELPMYKAEDVLEKAEEFYSFVTKKD
jgi:hypothetical protein